MKKRFAQVGPLPVVLVPPVYEQLNEQGFNPEETIFAGMAPQKSNVVSLNNGRHAQSITPLFFVLFSRIVEDGETMPPPNFDIPGMEILNGG